MSLSQQTQHGMTLIEMSIVLMVVSLLIMGIMQGQSLVRAAQVRDVIATVHDLSAAVIAFKDRYHVLPGDHPLATTEISGTSGNGDGNGRISVAEANLFANHLIRAGLIKGDATQPLRSSYGGIWLVQQGSTAPCGVAVNSTAPLPQASNVMVFANLPGDVAEELDRKMDDGAFNSGRIRASVVYTTATVQCLAIPL